MNITKYVFLVTSLDWLYLLFETLMSELLVMFIYLFISNIVLYCYKNQLRGGTPFAKQILFTNKLHTVMAISAL